MASAQSGRSGGVQQPHDIPPFRFPPSSTFGDEIPRTLSGKKMELPVRKLLLGSPPGKVANPDSMANPATFDYFVKLQRR